MCLESKESPEDNIGELQTDNDGRQFRMVGGKKIYQIEEKTQREVDLNRDINLVRLSGMTPGEYLKEYFKPYSFEKTEAGWQKIILD